LLIAIATVHVMGALPAPRPAAARAQLRMRSRSVSMRCSCVACAWASLGYYDSCLVFSNSLSWVTKHVLRLQLQDTYVYRDQTMAKCEISRIS